MGFLEGMMRRLGFAETWITSIMQCITFVSYSVVVNGVPNGLIYPSRGLRQGDPLSPYLFLLCGERLLALLHQAQKWGIFMGWRVLEAACRFQIYFLRMIAFCFVMLQWKNVKSFWRSFGGMRKLRVNQ